MAKRVRTPPRSAEELSEQALRVFLYRLEAAERKDQINGLLHLAETVMARIVALQGFPLTNNLAQMMLVRLQHDHKAFCPEPPVRLQ